MEEPTFCNPFLNYMSRDVLLDEHTKAIVAQSCQLVKLPKGTKLLETGNVCKYVYFIVSGECISYFTDFHGKTITWFFHFNTEKSSVKNVFAVDYKSFLSGRPSTLSIITFSPVTALRISIDAAQTLIEQSPVYERWVRLINEKIFIQIYDRIHTLLTLSAPDRYEKFMEDECYLLNMFPNYLIASYLHVAAPSLSRIRKKSSLK